MEWCNCMAVEDDGSPSSTSPDQSTLFTWNPVNVAVLALHWTLPPAGHVACAASAPLRWTTHTRQYGIDDGPLRVLAKRWV